MDNPDYRQVAVYCSLAVAAVGTTWAVAHAGGNPGDVAGLGFVFAVVFILVE